MTSPFLTVRQSGHVTRCVATGADLLVVSRHRPFTRRQVRLHRRYRRELGLLGLEPVVSSKHVSIRRSTGYMDECANRYG